MPQPFITIIYDYFTPAFKAGGPTQSLANLVSNVTKLPIKVICTNKDLDGTVLKVPTDSWCQVDHALVWYASEKSQKSIDSLIETDDILFINSIFSHHFDYGSLLKSKAKRKIISPRGMLDKGSLSQKAWKKKIYLTYWKLMGFHKLCEWHASSEEEKKGIQKVFGKQSKIWVVPNFPRIIPFQTEEKKQGQLTLISIAVISPMKNHLLVLEALKNVKAAITYHIYGPIKDANYWEECKAAIQQLHENIEVHFHGDVIPEKVPEALSKAHIAILPSKSENFGHSIFEALTAGKPVITSHHTPWNQLKESNAGINVDIEKSEELSNAISFFAAMNHEDFQIWSSSASMFALKSMDIEAIKEGYLKMFGANE